MTYHVMTTHNCTIPDRSLPGSTRTAPSAVHQDGGVKCATGASSKIQGRDNITIGTWNTRTLKAAGKLQELTHEMDRYRWNILGLCEMRWKNFGETTTWFWPDLMNGKHDHTTAVCVFLRLSGSVCVVQLPAGSWHRLPCW